jgi:hypothetical protein
LSALLSIFTATQGKPATWILIHRDSKEQWLKLFSDLNYPVYQEGDGFLQLSPPKDSAWPVDLMLVRENTFGPMHSASREVDLYDVQIRIIKQLFEKYGTTALYEKISTSLANE